MYGLRKPLYIPTENLRVHKRNFRIRRDLNNGVDIKASLTIEHLNYIYKGIIGVSMQQQREFMHIL